MKELREVRRGDKNNVCGGGGLKWGNGPWTCELASQLAHDHAQTRMHGPRHAKRLAMAVHRER